MLLLLFFIPLVKVHLKVYLKVYPHTTSHFMFFLREKWYIYIFLNVKIDLLQSELNHKD